MKTLFTFALCVTLSSAFAQETNTHSALVRKMDALRLPPPDLTARVTVRKTKAGASDAVESHYRMYSRRRMETDGRVLADTLVVCNAPPRDAGKMMLFNGGACWFFDPPAKHAKRLPSQRAAAHALLADMMNWRFADEFDHKLAGQETLAVAGKPHDCTVLDFTPRQGMKNRSPKVRCWIDAAGRSWKAEHYTASGKLFRTVLFTKYDTMLGVERPVELRIGDADDLEEVKLSGAKASRSPDEYFDPGKLPGIVIKPP